MNMLNTNLKWNKCRIFIPQKTPMIGAERIKAPYHALIVKAFKPKLTCEMTPLI